MRKNIYERTRSYTFPQQNWSRPGLYIWKLFPETPALSPQTITLLLLLFFFCSFVVVAIIQIVNYFDRAHKSSLLQFAANHSKTNKHEYVIARAHTHIYIVRSSCNWQTRLINRLFITLLLSTLISLFCLTHSHIIIKCNWLFGAVVVRMEHII